MSDPLHFVVPGRLDQRTGGYLYDARIVSELRAAGVDVRVHEVPGRFPLPDAATLAALDRILSGIPEGARVMADGLALGASPEVAATHGRRLELVALVHHPLADETGLDDEARNDLRDRERRVLAAAAGTIVTSPTTAERLGAFDVPADRVRVVEPGTDRAVPSPGPGLNAPPRLLCVGTVTPRKGQDLLVRALASLADRAWDCVCVGSLERAPAFAHDVVRTAAEAGLETRIRFTGEVEPDELDAAWRAASVFVLPSWYEGYGMALAEAVARGLPVISTTGGAIPETVPAGAGRLVEPGDVDGLAAAIDAVITDPQLRDEMAAAARAAALQLPDWGLQARRFRLAVDELATIARRRRSTPTERT